MAVWSTWFPRSSPSRPDMTSRLPSSTRVDANADRRRGCADDPRVQGLLRERALASPAFPSVSKKEDDDEQGDDRDRGDKCDARPGGDACRGVHGQGHEPLLSPAE